MAPGQPAENREAVLATLSFLPSVYPLVRQYEQISELNVNGTIVPMGRTRIPVATPWDRWNAQGRLDHQLGQKDSLTYRYQWGRFEAPLATLGPGMTNNSFGPRFASSEEIVYASHAVSHTRVFSPRWLNEVRLAYTRAFNDAQPLGEAGPSTAINNFFTFGGAVAAPWQRDARSWQWQDVVTHQQGRHGLKAGVDLNRVRVFVLNQATVRGQWTFMNFADFLYRAFRFTQAFVPSITDIVSLQHSYFVQDDIKIRLNLTVNIGLRYQIADVPEGLYGTTDPALLAVGVPEPVRRDSNDWAPRVGIAYSPGKGRMVLRGGFGISYLQGTSNTFVPMTRNNYPRNAVDERAQAATVNQYPTIPPKPAAIPPLNPAQVFTNAMPDIQNPTTHFYSASVQRQFGRDYIAELGYSGNRSYHLQRMGERNPAILTEAQGNRSSRRKTRTASRRNPRGV
ncbi:MAG TPA: TonB-dependent receptor [Bryobacteraceae bacterium]|nr:TonB-dependent receptor [Bryobacteraceae bacterium]